MAHEIQRSDRLILNSGLPAWHGYGTVVNCDLTPTEAIREVLGWEPTPEEVFVRNADGSYAKVPGFKANRRDDTGDVLGIVTDTYKIISNRELAQFAEALVGADRAVQVETAGSLRGGRRVFCLCRLPKDVIVKGDDVVQTYVCFSNTHDGSACCYGMWTSVRVVCANTLGAALGFNFEHADTAANAGTAVRIYHTGEIDRKVSEARRVLGVATTQTERFQRLAEAMANKPLFASDRSAFFRRCYAETYGAPPEKVETKEDAAANARYNKIVGEWAALLDDPNNQVSGIAGTVWACLQAVTQWHDHVRSGNRVNADGRKHSNMFGASGDDKRVALKVAAALV